MLDLTEKGIQIINLTVSHVYKILSTEWKIFLETHIKLLEIKISKSEKVNFQ